VSSPHIDEVISDVLHAVLFGSCAELRVLNDELESRNLSLVCVFLLHLVSYAEQTVISVYYAMFGSFQTKFLDYCCFSQVVKLWFLNCCFWTVVSNRWCLCIRL
jgi:hypothetical protein